MAREADAAECVLWSDRQAAKRSIDALVLQIRMERMGRWIGRIAMILFALALILVALQKPISGTLLP